jgi:hypothetical protein
MTRLTPPNDPNEAVTGYTPNETGSNAMRLRK